MLLVMDRTKYAMLDVIFAAMTTMVLNILLIPSYGIIGAAIATSTATVLAICLDTFFAWKFTKMNPFDLKAIIKSVLAGMVSISLVLLIYRYVGLSASLVILMSLFILFLLTYSGLLVVFRALDKNDIFILKELEKKSRIRVGFVRRIIKRIVR